MTIYTPSQPEKKPASDGVEPEVVTELLPDEKKDKEALAAVMINNDYNDGRAIYLRAKRRSAFMHMLLAIIVLAVLALGAIGSVVLYRHLNKKVYTGRCGNEFYDLTFHDTLQATQDGSMDGVPKDYVDEDYVVCPEENYEELHTPRFDDVRETYVLHDFDANYSAIIDHEMRKCFIMPIRRNIIRPSEVVIQIQERRTFGLVLQTVVIREDYVMGIPDYFSRPLGKRIYEACYHYGTYKLELYVFGVVKRSASEMARKQNLNKPVGTYAIMTNNMTHQQMYKIIVHEPMKLPLE